MIIVHHFKWLLFYNKINLLSYSKILSVKQIIYSKVNRIIFKIDKQLSKFLYIYIFYYIYYAIK